jgi:RNA polymerase sigma factor (sigma-70 family)
MLDARRRLLYTMELETFKARVIPVKDRLYRLALSMLHAEADAQDVLQEAMLRLWERRAQLDSYHSIEALAIRIVKNLCLDRLKMQKRRRNVELETAFRLESDQAKPDRETEARDALQLMRQLLRSLPEQQQMLLQLREVEELSYEEIEESTGLSINTIRVNISRARKTLKAKFEEVNDYEIR